MANINTDIIVVGAGLVGLAATIAFARQGKKVVLLDAKKPAIEKQQTWDERIYALTPESEKWLNALDVWAGVDLSRVNVIHAMHLWGETFSDPLVLSDNDANLPKLGLIIENQNLMVALWQQIQALGLTVITDAKCKFLDYAQQDITLTLSNEDKVTAKLLVAADGVNSWVRQQVNIVVEKKDFHQTAVVANFLAEKNHRSIARQWFSPHETLALLPLPNQYVSMVWSVSTERANKLLSLSSEELAEKVELRSKYELGALQLIGNTLQFTLNQQTVAHLIAERVALVGDAAHQIHPMAGQGVNLGFRDVIALEEVLAGAHAMQDIGEKVFLRKYERSRKADIASMKALTIGLDYLFASDSGMIKKVTSWGLRQLKRQATIKKLLIQQATA
jgi:ubiquinone biosynthesis UbiH/UbiF/VisC/COQ6 family hydroxylase